MIPWPFALGAALAALLLGAWAAYLFLRPRIRTRTITAPPTLLEERPLVGETREDWVDIGGWVERTGGAA